ncbi:protein kinase [Streptomyces sp. T-3]|nr:protein kinase [Streptomyces sp. T-3]
MDEALEAPAVWGVGDVIDGRYEVSLVHEHGGMGLVYRVRHLAWGIDLAVKCPRPEWFRSAADRERFTTEAETWVSLGLHPNVCSCYYVRTMGGIPRVFAEYVPGGSLREWINDRRLYGGGRQEALTRILDLAIQVAWGLEHAHSRRLVHQDVKPGNILIEGDSPQELTAKVTDFGLARAQATARRWVEGGDRSSHKTVMVPTGGMTRAYASPEQLAGQALGRRSDVYSFAVSVLEMFTGGVTWMVGSAAREVLAAYRAAGPEEDGLPQAPDALADLLERCLETDPGQRPRTMAEVADALVGMYGEVAGPPYPHPQPAAADLQADEWNNRALSLVDLGRPAQAEEAFAAALEADPRHVRATYNAGMWRWRRGEISDAGYVADMEAVRADTGDSWQARLALLQVHLERADLEAARALAGGLIREQPDEPEIQEAMRTLRSADLTGAGCVDQAGVPWLAHPPTFRTAIRLTPDLRFAFVGDRDGTLRLWDVQSGNCLVSLQGHEREIRFVDLSADGRFALSAGADEVVGFWDLTEGRCLGRAAIPLPEGRPYKGAIRKVRLSGDASVALCATSYGKILVWEFHSGKGRFTLDCPDEHGRTLEVSDDARWALSGGGNQHDKVRLWDLSTGRLRHVLQGCNASEPRAISADGTRAVTSGGDGKIRIWDISSGRLVRMLTGHSKAAATVSLTADGRHAISGGRDKSIRLWDLATGRCLRSFEGLEDEPLAVALSPDGRRADSVEPDVRRTWELPGGHASALLPSRPRSHSEVARLRARVTALAEEAEQARASGRHARALELLTQARNTPGFERDPQLLSAWQALGRSTRRTGLRSAWPVRTLHTHDRYLNSVDVSGDGRIAVTAGSDRTARLWDLGSGACIRVLDGHSHHKVESVRLSADGRYVLSGCQDGTVRLWRADDGECLRVLDGHLHGILWMRFSPDGRSALVGAVGNMIRVWDLESSRLPMTLEADRDQADTAGAGDGERLVAHRGYAANCLQLWDLDSGQGVLTLRGHADQLASVCLSADERAVLSSERTIRLWDTATGQCVRVFGEEAGPANAVQLSADGRFAVSGHTDSLVRVWDVDSGRCLRTLEGHRTSVSSIALTPDGRYALSGEQDGIVRLWELDWELAAREPADWDEAALAHVKTFLAWHPAPLADRDVDTLLERLGDAGYGWLRPDGVRAQLQRLAAAPSTPSRPRTVAASPAPVPAHTRLNPVGLYRQMYEGRLDHLPSIHDARTGQVVEDRAQIIAYMKTEEFVAIDFMSATPDLLRPQEVILGGPSLHTDGVWVWRTDSIHYLENYQLDLPEDFLRHVRASAYRPGNEHGYHDYEDNELDPFM